MGIKGDLRSIPLWEILQTLSVGRKTGKLEIDNGIKKAEIYFDNGKIVNIKTGFVEGYNALLGLALWDTGDFVFYPDELSSTKVLSLDPLEVYVNLSKYIDIMSYLSDLILIPVRVDGLALEEEVVSSSFDGIAKVRDVVLNSPLGELKTLEFVQKLMEEKKLIRIEEDKRIFWFYIFWRYWRFLTLEDGRKYLVNERSLRKDLQFFASNTVENFSALLEDLISSDKISWHYFYRHITKFSESDVELFIREAFEIINKYVKSTLDKTKVEQILVILKEKGKCIFIPICKDLTSDQFIISLLFDGEHTLKQVFDSSPLNKIETQRIILGLYTQNCIIDVLVDKKIEIIYSFYVFWKSLLRELERYNLVEDVIEIWDDYMKNSIMETRFLFDRLVLDKNPNFVYFYKEKEKYTEEEIKGFIKNGVELIYKNLEDKILSQEFESVLQKVLREIEEKVENKKELYSFVRK